MALPGIIVLFMPGRSRDDRLHPAAASFHRCDRHHCDRDLRERRGRTALSEQADPPDRPAGRRKHGRHRVALRRPGAREGARPAHRRREQARRRRHDRDGRARARSGRRLHDRVRVARHAGVQPGDLREARLRLGEGLPADRVPGRRVERHDRPADERCDEAHGRHRRCEGEAGRIDVLLRRRGHQPSPVRRAVRTRHGHEPRRTCRTRVRRRACSP